jgi:hypothetical protein
VFRYADPCALLPVLHRGRVILARWGCRRNESRILPRAGWTTTRSAAAVRYWRSVGGVAVVVPAYRGFEDGAWVRLRGPVRAVLAYDERGQPHAFIVCEAARSLIAGTTRSELKQAMSHTERLREVVAQGVTMRHIGNDDFSGGSRLRTAQPAEGPEWCPGRSDSLILAARERHRQGTGAGLP